MLPEENTDNNKDANFLNQQQQHLTPVVQYGINFVGSESLFSGNNSHCPGEAVLDAAGQGHDRSEGQKENARMNNTASYIQSSAEKVVLSPYNIPESSGHGRKTKQSPATPTGPPRDRISEYEASCERSPLKGSGKGKGRDLGDLVQFRVQKTNWDSTTSPISRFPNEVLTHTFSYLDAGSLSALSLVCKRFHSLVTSPHAWRSAFVRFFPGQTLNEQPTSSSPQLHSHDEEIRTLYSNDRRYFTRLNALSTWRKEYILRTSLLRSLSRGKPYIPQYTPTNTPNAGNATNAGSIITYPACTGGNSVTHISASFPLIDRDKQGDKGIGLAALRPHLLHSSCETIFVTSSDPTTGRIDRTMSGGAPVTRPNINWPIAGFSSHMPGIELGNSLMDLSEEMGWVVGETVPGGRVYVEPKSISIDAAHATRGRFLSPSENSYNQEKFSYISAVWIAKRRVGSCIFETTNGMCGVMVGESKGRVSMYALPNTLKQKRDPDTWTVPVKSWMVSPGVPIIGIKVDEDYSVRRQRRYKRMKGGVIVVVVNALGEVFYLNSLAGDWKIIPQTTRSLNPLSGLSTTDVNVLSTERRMLELDWMEVKQIWNGWGMDYFLEVDFADTNVLLGKRGTNFHSGAQQEDVVTIAQTVKGTWLKVFHLDQVKAAVTDDDKFVQGLVYIADKMKNLPKFTSTGPIFSTTIEHSTITRVMTETAYHSDSADPDDLSNDMTMPPHEEDEWTYKDLSFAHEQSANKNIEITAHAIDSSNLALFSPDEDPSLKESCNDFLLSQQDLPGRRARLFTVGTSTGSVFVWNIRCSSIYSLVEQPLRIIHTESPSITTVGLTSLYIVHGGSDGLVQCWDPLSSTLAPMRTIHSRFSSRARRRMAQAYNNLGLQGDNQYAARAVCLDPDPTVLRGVIALGTYIRYWSFAGDVSSQINGRRKKKVVRRAGVGGGGTGHAPGRARTKHDILGEISSETMFLQKERERKRKEDEWWRNRFGIEEGSGLSEEEMLMYAKMLSEEAFEVEKVKLTAAGIEVGESSSETFQHNVLEENESISSSALSACMPSSSANSINDAVDEEADIDSDVAEAIRLSLLESSPGAGISFRYDYGDRTPDGAGDSAKVSFFAPAPSGNGTNVSTPEPTTNKKGSYDDEWPSPRHAAIIPEDKFNEEPVHSGPGLWIRDDMEDDEIDDIAYAIRLSLAEESRRLAAALQMEAAE